MVNLQGVKAHCSRYAIPAHCSLRVERHMDEEKEIRDFSLCFSTYISALVILKSVIRLPDFEGLELLMGTGNSQV